MDAPSSSSSCSPSQSRSGVTCAFVAAPHCSHEELFSSDYQRANRLHQTKILRCFPHCCPGHVDRSYCGSSLWLRVQSSGAEHSSFSSPAQQQQLCVFARFRPVAPSTAATLNVNDVLSLDRVHGSLQSETTPCGEWITSELVNQETNPQTNTTTWLFEINPSRRWYYPWRSGKRNAQRFTMHALEAVVFSSAGGSRHHDDDSARVVATTQSKAFTIVSFRRRHDSSDDSTKQEPLTALEAGLLQRFLDQSSTNERAGHDAIQHLEVRQGSPHNQRRRDTSHSGGSRHAYARAFTNELSMLFASVQEVFVRDVAACVPTWSRYEPVPPVSLRVATASTHPSAVANVVWWLCMDPLIHRSFQHHAAWAGSHLLNSRALEHAFAQWNQWLCERINAFLEPYSLSWPVILASIDYQARPSQPPLSCCFDWEAFVAQARQCAVNRTTTKRPTRSFRRHILNGCWRCPLRGVHITNIYNVPHVASSPSSEYTRMGFADLPFTTVLAFWQQLAWIDIHADSNGHEPWIAIESAVPTKKSDGDPTETTEENSARLILDGRSRCFNTLPHGESTLRGSSGLLNGQCFGDYVGVVDHVAGELHVTCFSWPSDLWRRRSSQNEVGGADLLETLNCAAYRWSWTLSLEPRDEQLMELHVLVAHTFITDHVDPRGGGLACMTIHERLALVDQWNDVYAIQCLYQRVTRAKTITASVASDSRCVARKREST